MAQLFRMAPGSSIIQGHVATAPPAGSYPVTNLYWDPAISELVGEYDDAGAGSGNIESSPPVGKYAITNIYFDPATGVFVGEYDDGA